MFEGEVEVVVIIFMIINELTLRMFFSFLTCSTCFSLMTSCRTRCLGLILESEVCTVQCAVCSKPRAVYSVQYVVYSVHCAVRFVHCRVYSGDFKMLYFVIVGANNFGSINLARIRPHVNVISNRKNVIAVCTE